MRREYYGHANTSGVYRITNTVNGKFYIGSAKRFKDRANSHYRTLKNNKHHNKHLQAFFVKYGEDAFLFEVVEVVLGTKLDRTTREEELLQDQIKAGNWQSLFNLQEKARQMDGFPKDPAKLRERLQHCSRQLWSDPDHRRRMSENAKASWADPERKQNTIRAMKEAIQRPEVAANRKAAVAIWSQSKEHKEKTSVESRKRWENPQYKQEIRAKISAGKKAQWADPTFRVKMKGKFGKRVAQIDPKTNEIIKEFPSAHEAGKATGINYRNISATCTGVQKTAGGFRWKFNEAASCS